MSAAALPLIHSTLYDWPSSQVIVEGPDFAESFYRHAFEQAGAAMAMVAVDGRLLNVNRAFCRMTDYSREELLERTFQSITHPDDLDADLHNLERLMLGEIPGYSMEKRYVRADGAIIWVELHVGIVRGVHDEPLYFVAQAQDVSARKEAEAARDRALLQTQAVLQAATHVSIIATDVQGRITVFNPGAELLLGYSADEVVGKATPTMFHFEAEVKAHGEELSRRFGRTLTGFDVFVEHARHGRTEEREWTYICKDGRHITVSLVVTAQRDGRGYITGFLGIATDVTKRKQSEAELRKLTEHLSTLASVDALTGIDNRRSILARLDREWLTARPDEPFSIILLDVDHFKRINDRLGHAAGDEVLKEVARMVKASLRHCDFVGRYGGEEFLVICPRASVVAASVIAERIRTAVQAKQFLDHEIPVTVSLGVCSVSEELESADAMVAVADERMYTAKRHGRNCLVAL
jgi:diguanylate cyclase (GGDEF)-like protein/PAS domain S-box-containing protein